MMLGLSHDWRLAVATVGLAGVLDVLVGEPPSALHPVVWMGRLVGFFERRRPRGRPRLEVAYGVLVVVATAGCAAAAGAAVAVGLERLPWWAGLIVSAAVLKTTFSLRGLVRAGREVQHALLAGDTGVGELLRALVSRSPTSDTSHVVSAAVESLAENLTDSVVSPLAYGVVCGLPGALAYRAVNTMDAMLGYRDDREYVGKAAARTDDAVNYVPTRLTALLLVAAAMMRGTAGRAWRALRTQHLPQYGPNKTVVIATMAGALRVQLVKPGAYELGAAERPLTAAVIGDAAQMVWVVGVTAIVAAAGLAGFVAWAMGA